MRQIARAAALVLTCAVATACGGSETRAQTVEPWPEADALFHQDPRWLGSDGGASVDLGGGRSLWLFGDTFVALDRRDVRERSCMVRNTVAVMDGRSPETATMTFHWRTAPDGLPESFFPAGGRDICFQADDSWFWPLDGVRVESGGPLVVFLSRLRPDREGLGFAGDGWEAVLVENPDDDPEEWRVDSLGGPPNPWGIELGNPAVHVEDNWLYAFGTSEPFDVHLARWPVGTVLAGDLGAPEWWTGEERGFVPEVELDEKPATLFADALAESVREVDGGFVALQTIGIGKASLGVRRAPAVTGPWSEPEVLWQPPEAERAGVSIYGFETHPELDADGALALSYGSNADEFADVIADESLYYPRFVNVRFER